LRGVDGAVAEQRVEEHQHDRRQTEREEHPDRAARERQELVARLQGGLGPPGRERAHSSPSVSPRVKNTSSSEGRRTLRPTSSCAAAPAAAVIAASSAVGRSVSIRTSGPSSSAEGGTANVAGSTRAGSSKVIVVVGATDTSSAGVPSATSRPP